ncbi:hypothetical protein [Sporanaerobacter acetigenes]|uniref:Uncharacterized protein n=1 Tax=Sporanaerobacter acetigenes DSM 13106 TaxID=1123281 RepID=A0A1M5TXI6_9FIRM|nr:hypothetical protein [Sporanaerobacter acetigenes]SHH55535.1 hypothetical protein SAMN02745180_00464 [Sporanaerobacter acetigenes DSM 13106]
MTDRELLELIAAQVGELIKDVSTLKVGQNNLKDEVKKTNVTIENDIQPKINALFDGYKQNPDKLNKIEEEVSKHEEFILKRVK